MAATKSLHRPRLLEWARRIRDNPAAAIGLGVDCLRRARLAEPVLHAFEYLPTSPAIFATGPLEGIPVAIKDIIATSDMPTTNGSPIYAGWCPDQDARVVEHLRHHGAAIFGKTVSTEFAWRKAGPTRNPWNLAHTPGGSSSGSAAAVAAGIVPLALGSQTLGSVIRPAAFNGIVGLKPSFGAIPRVGVHPLSPSLDHVGLFANAVDDVAFALSCLIEKNDLDRHGLPLPSFEVPLENGVMPLRAPRIGVARLALWTRVDEAQRVAFGACIACLQQAGATLVEVDLPEIDQSAWSSINTILASEAALIFADLVTKFPDRTSNQLKELVSNGRSQSAYDYLLAKQTQQNLQQKFSSRMTSFDALLTLPAFGEAPEGLAYTGDAEYCAPWTLLGAPAISLPIGFGPRGLPLGIQLIGAYRADLKLLRVAKWVETTLDFDTGAPDFGQPG